MQERRQLETIAGRVNADGSIAAGDGFVVQKGAAGNYTVTFAGGFRLVGAQVTVAQVAGSQAPMTSGYTERSFNLLINNTGGVGTDTAFSFHADGVQT